MPATLKLTHKAIGAEVRRGTYDVVVDGERAGHCPLLPGLLCLSVLFFSVALRVSHDCGRRSGADVNATRPLTGNNHHLEGSNQLPPAARLRGLRVTCLKYGE